VAGKNEQKATKSREGAADAAGMSTAAMAAAGEVQRRRRSRRRKRRRRRRRRRKRRRRRRRRRRSVSCLSKTRAVGYGELISKDAGLEGGVTGFCLS
jgi:hypothetical protein